MRDRERIQVAVDELMDRGIHKDLASPPLYRLAWWLGIGVPPPFFQTFGQILWTHVAGIVVVGFFVTSIYLILQDPGIPNRHVLLLLFAVYPAIALVVGLITGIAGAVYYRGRARALGFPSWRDYRPGRLGGGSEPA